MTLNEVGMAYVPPNWRSEVRVNGCGQAVMVKLCLSGGARAEVHGLVHAARGLGGQKTKRKKAALLTRIHRGHGAKAQRGEPCGQRSVREGVPEYAGGC